MIGIIEGLSLSTILSIVSVLGLPGLVLIFWYVDHRRYERDRKEHREELAKVMKKYEDDMKKVTSFYEDNVLLVKGYERLSGDLANIIHLNTQVQTELVHQVKNNQYCPAVRGKGGQ